MKIIKEGDTTNLLPWYVEKEFGCSQCGCIFRLEAVDLDDRWRVHHYHSRDDDYDYVWCPTCTYLVTLNDQSVHRDGVTR